MWGEQPKSGEAAPPLSKPLTSELGCVTPYIIVPGDWSEGEMDYVVMQVVAGLTHNASHNCNSAKVLLTHRAWPLRQRFLAALRAALAAAAPRYAYYPGSDARYAAFLSRYPHAEVLGRSPGAGPGAVPWTLVADLTANLAESALSSEAWCGVLAEVPLDVPSVADYLALAGAAANDACWGTLSASVFASPATQREHAAAFDGLIAALRFGAVVVNAPSFLAFVVPALTWGGFPGHTLADVGSGIGTVHNALMLDHPQKCVRVCSSLNLNRTFRPNLTGV